MNQGTQCTQSTTNSVLDLTALTARVAANEASITSLNTKMSATDDALTFLCKGVDAYYNLASDCCHVVGTNTVSCLPRVSGVGLIDDGGGAGKCATCCDASC